MKHVGSAPSGPSLPLGDGPSSILTHLLTLLPALHAVVGRMARSMHLPCVAEDIVQESLYRLLRSLRGGTYLVTQSRTLFSYLYRTAHNLLLDLKRSRSRAAFVSLDATGDDGQAFEAPDRGPSTHDLLAEAELTERLGRELALLSERDQQVWLLTQACGLSAEEAAEVIGVKRGTISTIVYRIRQRLAKVLAR